MFVNTLLLITYNVLCSQLVENCSGVAEVIGSYLVKSLFFSGDLNITATLNM